MGLNDILIGITALVFGYFLGSISFSRVVARFVSPGVDLEKTLVPIEGSEEKVQMIGVSPTSVRYSLGPKYGLLASFLDMLKVAVPVALFHFLVPNSPADYLAATGGILGHAWSLYHKFVGGYGVTAIYGALLVLDWPAVLVSFAGAYFLSLIFNKIYAPLSGVVALLMPVLLLIPWFLFLHHEPFALMYIGVCSATYLIRIIPQIKAGVEVLKLKSNAEEKPEGG